VETVILNYAKHLIIIVYMNTFHKYFYETLQSHCFSVHVIVNTIYIVTIIYKKEIQYVFKLKIEVLSTLKQHVKYKSYYLPITIEYIKLIYANSV